jgi:iron complex transport system substrate-binding protein
MRVVSLLASGTEIVCALELGETLVGRSHECDNPGWVRALPACSEPAFDVSMPSKEIDREVGRRIRSGEPLYHIHTDLIRELRPDVIIAQEHCEVCAVTPAGIAHSGCVTPAENVVALTAGSLDGIWEGMMSVARALGREETGRTLVCREQGRLDHVREVTEGHERPTVVMLEWMEPLYAMANWGPELVEIANGELLLGKKGEHSSAIPFERLREADPEVLIVAPCGFDLERTLRERGALEDQPGWRELRAVKRGKVVFADGNRFFNRSGMTVAETAEIIAELLHGVSFGDLDGGPCWQWIV